MDWPKALHVSKTSFVHSIRFRITVWFVLILAAVLTAFSVFIYFAQRRDLQADAVAGMEEKVSRLEFYFRSSAWQDSTVSPTDVPGNAAPLQKGDIMMLTDVSGRLVQTWGPNTPNAAGLVSALLSAAGQSRGPSVFQKAVSVAGGSASTTEEYLFTVTPVVRGDLLLGYLLVGSPSPLTGQLNRLILSLAFGALGMLLVAFVGGLWLADRAMRPVKTITQTARSIGEGDLSRRLNIAGRDELAELAGTFDEMLGRLQSAFDRQRRFIADASHELRTPLTIINMEVDRVLTGPHAAGDYRNALTVVDGEGKRMSRLVGELMTLARMDAGQHVLHTETVDLSELAVEAVDRMGGLASRHGATITTRGLPELFIGGDPQYLLQLISNLIENAIKHTEKDQSVLVETYAAADRGRKLAVLSVSDNGPGILPEHLGHIFDRFYRADPARSSENDDEVASPSGSGLGLAIVAEIAKAHGGDVQVESRLDSGSTFRVRLPLLDSQTARSIHPDSRVPTHIR